MSLSVKQIERFVGTVEGIAEVLRDNGYEVEASRADDLADALDGLVVGETSRRLAVRLRTAARVARIHGIPVMSPEEAEQEADRLDVWLRQERRDG